MQKTLGPGAIGLRNLPLPDAIELARAVGFDAVTANGLKTPVLTLGVTGAETMTRPDVGDESLAWRIAGGAGTSRVLGSAVAFRRGLYIVVVLLFSEGDVAGLARTLDARAKEAQ